MKKRFILIPIIAIAFVTFVWIAKSIYSEELRQLTHRADGALGSEVFDRAEHYYRKALLWNPFSDNLRRGLGLALVGQGRFGEAEKILNGVLLRNPKDELVLDGLARICLAQSRLEEAETYTRRITEINPETVFAYPHLTEIYRRRGDYKRAERYGIAAIRNARHLPAIPPDWRMEPMKVMIDIFTETQRFEEARKGIELLARLYPEAEVGMIFELAKTNEYLKNKGDAIETWEKFLQISKDYSNRPTLNNFQRERAFAEQRLKEIEKGNFLTPPSPKNRLNWGEIPKTE